MFLSLPRARISASAFSRRLEAHAPGELDGIDVSGNPDLARDVVDLLLASGHVPHLRHLDLSAVPLQSRPLAQLVSSPEVARLEVLLLGGIGRDELRLDFGDRADSRWAAVLTCQLRDEALLALAESPHLESLRALDLSYAEAGNARGCGLLRLASSHG